MNLKYLLLSLLGTCLIVYVSSIPNRFLWGNGSTSQQIISNLAHIPAYALLTFLWLKAFDTRKNRTQFHKFSASHLLNCPYSVLAGMLMFAVSDEIHQSFTPGRMASYADVGLNITGILCGFYAFKIFRPSSVFQGN